MPQIVIFPLLEDALALVQYAIEGMGIFERFIVALVPCIQEPFEGASKRFPFDLPVIERQVATLVWVDVNL